MAGETGGERPDPRCRRVRDRLEGMRIRAEKSTSWASVMHYLPRLINREGFVPVRAKVSREDIAFLRFARDDLIDFAELGLRLLDLHQPREAASGVSSDLDNPVRRCRACMWRWPCPTVRAVEDAVDRPASP